MLVFLVKKLDTKCQRSQADLNIKRKFTNQGDFIPRDYKIFGWKLIRRKELKNEV